MKLKTLASLLVLALTISANASWCPQGCSPPTCDPNDPNCTLDNGCGGNPCAMPTINLTEATAVSQFVRTHGK